MKAPRATPPAPRARMTEGQFPVIQEAARCALRHFHYLYMQIDANG